jgi:hypothetical protein
MRQSLYILFAFLTVSLSAAEVTLNVSSASKNVPVNGQAHLTVTAQWPQGEKTYIVFKPDMPQLSGLKIADHVCYHESVRNTSQGIQRIVHHFKLLVTNAPGTRAETGSIFIEYRSFKEGNKQQRQLAGLSFNVTPAKHPVLKGALIAMGSATLLGACALLLGIRRYGRKGGMPATGSATLEDHFLEELHSARRGLIDGDITQYFHDVETLMRRYFRTKYQIGSIEDWEIPEAGPAGPDERTTSVARELLKLSHSVRYAGYVPSTHEKNRMYSFLKTLLIKNQPRPPKPEEELYLKEETPL